MRTKSYLLLSLIITMTACAWTSHEYQICRQWQHEGKVLSTIDSCRRCVYELGDGKPEVINGCALGIDAANLIELANQ